MTNPVESPEHGRNDGELGPGSLWFLRVVSAVVILVLLWFLVDAVQG